MGAHLTRQDSHQRLDRKRARMAFDTLLKKYKHTPGEVAVRMAQGALECTRCDSFAEVSTITMLVHTGERDHEAFEAAKTDRRRWPCPYCAGTGIEHVEPNVRLQAEREILQRMVPVVKALEIDGGVEHRFTFVNLSGEPLAEVASGNPALARVIESEADDDESADDDR